MDYFNDFFSSDFMPHGHCYFWKPEIVWTNAISDAIIALAYLTIPFTLVYIVRLRKDMNFMSMLFLFATFILGCGATHVMDVINIWKPFYYVDSSLRVITAIASLGTAIMLVKITPKIVLIPNPQEFKDLNENLRLQLSQLEEKEKLLREREALLLETQEIANIGSFDLDVKSGKYKWTPQMYAIFGYAPTETINRQKIFDRIHPDDRVKLKLAIESALASKDNINLDCKLLLPDGSVKHAWTRGISQFDENLKPVRFVGTVLDFTGKYVTEQKLKAVQSELTQVKEFIFLAESLPQLVWTTSPDGKANYFNKKTFEYTGLTSKEVLEWGWVSMVHSEDKDEVIATWGKSLMEKTEYKIEIRLRKHDGTYRWFLVKAIPMKDKSGNVIKWFGTSTDIDDLKRSERELIKKNEELVKTNRDLDNFVYTASHDLKAPVANLEGLINVHRKKVVSRLSTDELKILDLMESSVSRFRDTINELTEISKIGKNLEEDIQLVFFNEALEDVKSDLLHEIQESNAQFYGRFEVPDVYFSRKNFKSIIYNLVSNSIKYRNAESQLLIEIRTYKEGKYTVLSVKDNGIGFDVSKKDVVFSMFRRLHNHVEGTGVGLYIVKRIVEDTGGKIDVQSEIGKGTIFKIYFL